MRRSAGKAVKGSSGGRPDLRIWVFRLTGLTLIPLMLFGLAEFGLWVGGYGYSPSFFKRINTARGMAFVENDQFGLRFFPPSLLRIPAPVVMRAAKTPQSLRIFILGESAALGDPRPNYSASRYMEALLRERFPGRDFEVVNTSITAINSHVIVPIARECAGYQGDFWIVYMGNNEMVGPYGAASVSGWRAPPLWLVRASLALQRFRTGQLLMTCGRKLLKGPASLSGWRGMEMFLGNELAPGDPRREVVYQNFRRNLDDIVRSGVDSGAKLLLNTIAVNLKDCPPFASFTPGNGERAEAFEKAQAEGLAALQKGDIANAKKFYEEAGRQLPGSAQAQFELGDCCLRLGEIPAAEAHFQNAVDLDTLPFRADSRINGLIRAAASRFAGQNVTLCDAAAILSSNSPAHITGQDSFYEHVHFNFDGNFVLGLAWAREIEQLMPAEVRQAASKDWASQENCERHLGLTDWNRLSTVEEVIRRLGGPPLSRQANNAVRVRTLQAQVEDLRQRTSTSSAALMARALYLDALARTPGDPCLHENFAEFLEATGDVELTVSQWEQTRDLIPHYYLPYYNLGIALGREGKFTEARDSLLKADALNPGSGDIRLEIGVTYARQSKWDTALQQFSQAHRLDPDNPCELLYSGEMLWKLDRRSESMQVLREAIDLQPDYWQAHYRLGDDLALAGQIEAAAIEFRETLRVNPGYVKAHENLGVALYKLGRLEQAIREFDETLRLDPLNRQALEFKRHAQTQMPNH